jgi:hypothetical protein
MVTPGWAIMPPEDASSFRVNTHFVATVVLYFKFPWKPHMIESVILDLVVVEPRTITGLPFEAANHTKLCPTTTKWRIINRSTENSSTVPTYQVM